MTKGLFTLLLLLVLPLQAEIYQSVDENGNIVFTDEPDSSSEKVELSEPTVYSSDPEPQVVTPVVPDIAVEELEADTVAYSLRIASPANNESIWNNEGKITVSVIVEPSLAPELGHVIVISVDGETVETQAGSYSAQFSNLDRGSHTAVAKLLNAEGVEEASSDAIQFTLHRTHVN